MAESIIPDGWSVALLIEWIRDAHRKLTSERADNRLNIVVWWGNFFHRLQPLGSTSTKNHSTYLPVFT
ncbi:MAG TPA: hypothetical protein VFH31_15845, partial [Pyrinomonadaceae bacterium]|nr:hypothetical protein [Pyrinomonadaceae bacterium]